MVNEENVDQYRLGGYEFVEHEVTIGHRKIDQASRIGGRIAIAAGNGVTAFAMRCPQEVYEEEIKLVDERTDATEQSMRRNHQGVQDGQYGKIEIGRGRNTI